MRNIVYPAVLATSWDEYRYKIETAATFAEGVQIDVMDGRFVPATTFYNKEKIESLKPGSLFFEIHLMVKNPLEHIRAWENVADSYILHRESAEDLAPVINTVLTMKKEVGIAINPETPLEEMYSYIPDIHTALIMTVTPGKDGQVYESEMNDKVATLRVKFPSLPIEVDGGVNSSTIGGAKKAGANIFVAGSAIWRAEEPRDMFIRLQQSVH